MVEMLPSVSESPSITRPRASAGAEIRTLSRSPPMLTRGLSVVVEAGEASRRCRGRRPGADPFNAVLRDPSSLPLAEARRKDSPWLGGGAYCCVRNRRYCRLTAVRRSCYVLQAGCSRQAL